MRQILVADRCKDGVGNVNPCLTDRKRAVVRKVVEREGNLLRRSVDSADKREEHSAKKKFHRLHLSLLYSLPSNAGRARYRTVPFHDAIVLN